jgi:hypothetical protein
MARDDGVVTEAHRKQVRATWLAIKDRIALSCDDQRALMDEVMGVQ